jgi:transcriptional regulator with XRE-family HTH domain
MSPVALRVLAPCHTGMSTTLGPRFRELRERLGMTQQQVGERAGYGRDAINKVEGGKSQVSSARMRDGLADALSLSRADLDAFIAGRITVDEAVARSGAAALPPSAPVPEIRVVRDDPESNADGLELVVGEAFDARAHQPRDMEAVLRLTRSRDFRVAADDPGALRAGVRQWLDAAASLRRRGQPVTPEALLVQLTVGSSSRAREGNAGRAVSWQDEAREASERADRGE